MPNLRPALTLFCALFASSFGFSQVQLTMMPAPKHLMFGKSVELKRNLKIESHEAEFESVVQAFVDDWKVMTLKSAKTLEVRRVPTLAPEEYQIKLGGKVTVSASTPTGLAWALQTLGQLFDQSTSAAEIHDKPDVPFRCVTIDVARRFHSILTLKTLARWCQLGKVRFMQLHLTDDQNWMLPSDAVPGVDQRNQHHRPGYSKSELADLQSFASARGVTIVPEIDIPGHSSLLVASNPGLFQIQNSESKGCANFGSNQVREKLKQLIDETAQLFSNSPYIHIGGDEAWYPNAEKDPAMAAAMLRLGTGSNPGQVFVDFVGEMADEVIRLKKKPIVWEGFSSSEFAKKRIPKQTVVVAWEGTYYPADKLVPDGFQVVNGGWDPNYVVNHFPYEAYTLVPLERLYKSHRQQFGIVSGALPLFKFPKSDLLLGSMLCWWEGYEWNAQRVLPERIAAFGCRLWNSADEKEYDMFYGRFMENAEKVMSHAHPFSFKVTGGLDIDHSQIVDPKGHVLLWPDFKGIKIAYRTDNLTPKPGDISDHLDIPIAHDMTLTVQAFRGSQPVGETMFLPFHVVNVEKNLALDCPVTTSCASDPFFGANRVTDGVSNVLSAFWLAYPNPQTLTIDLQSVQSIGRLEVVGFWATGQPTRYRLSLSKDNKQFHPVVDASKQTEPSTQKGYVHRITPEQARYIRIETLGGDLFPSTMTRINEIRAFKE